MGLQAVSPSGFLDVSTFPFNYVVFKSLGDFESDQDSSGTHVPMRRRNLHIYPGEKRTKGNVIDLDTSSLLSQLEKISSASYDNSLTTMEKAGP